MTALLVTSGTGNFMLCFQENFYLQLSNVWRSVKTKCEVGMIFMIAFHISPPPYING